MCPARAAPGSVNYELDRQRFGVRESYILARKERTDMWTGDTIFQVNIGVLKKASWGGAGEALGTRMTFRGINTEHGVKGTSWDDV